MDKLRILGLVTIAIFVIVLSCDDEVTLQNLNATSTDAFFKNKSEIEAASAGMYTHLQTQGLYQRYGYIIPDLMSDEMFPSGDPNFKPPYDFALSPTNGIVSSYWQQCFNGVGKANFVIGNEEAMRANLGPGADFTEGDLNQALGEGHFMRGLYYYLLVKRFGGVPMPLGYPVTEAQPRASEDEVYAQIISDFKRASELLRDKSELIGQEARASKGAALGMLGKVNLHRGNLQEAKDALNEITGYSLLPAEQYNDNFSVAGEFNDESMFEVNFTTDNANSWAGNGEGVNEITFHAQEYVAWGNARPSQKMVDEFESDDPRRQSAILLDGDTYGPGNALSWNNGTRWYKFSTIYDKAFEEIIPESTCNARFLRYADVVLMQAEVENRMGNDGTAPGQSLFYLNQLRQRFGLPEYGSAEMDARGYPVTTQQEVFDAIVHERMVELCGEQHRFDDLVRWGLDATELQLDNDGGQRGYNPEVHKFLPIPQSEIDTNANISSGDQNPGY